MNEEWKSIPGYEGLYEASSLGRIRSMLAHPKGRTPALHVLTPTLHANGYLNVGLRRDGRRQVIGVHRLVCAAFHGAPETEQEARHRDNDPGNNTPSNLCWGSHAEKRAGHRPGGESLLNEPRPHALPSQSRLHRREHPIGTRGGASAAPAQETKARRWRAAQNDTTNKEQS